MKIAKHSFLVIAVMLMSLLASGGIVRSDNDRDDHNQPLVRWDIISFQIVHGVPNLFPGGVASAIAEDSSKITVTGSGTFEVGEPREVSGGGTWETFSPPAPITGAVTSTGSGFYRVTRLVRWEDAPGSLPGPVIDRIGDKAQSSSGLAVLSIRYNDGERGVLVVSCHNPVGSPDAIFEGITATKGFVDYWNHELVVNGVDANRTQFHILRGPNN